MYVLKARSRDAQLDRRPASQTGEVSLRDEPTQKLLAFTLIGAGGLWSGDCAVECFAKLAVIKRPLLLQPPRVGSLADNLRKHLLGGRFKEARKRLVDERGVEAEVARAGLDEAERGVDAVERRWWAPRRGERWARAQPGVPRHPRQQRAVHRPLRHRPRHHPGVPRLAGNQAGGVAVVMAGISEALVATAVGLLVAIPAVVGFNFYNRRVRTFGADRTVAQTILAALRAEPSKRPRPRPRTRRPSGKCTGASSCPQQNQICTDQGPRTSARRTRIARKATSAKTVSVPRRR